MIECELAYDLDTGEFVKLCIDCGSTGVPNHHKAFRCDPCQTEVHREKQRIYYEKKSLAKPVKPPKEPKSIWADGNKFCEDCGSTEIRAHHRVIRCDPCQKTHFNTQAVINQQRWRAENREKYLEADREAHRKFRAEHPERKKEHAQRYYAKRKGKLIDIQTEMDEMRERIQALETAIDLLSKNSKIS